jgi:hypothetical protein
MLVLKKGSFVLYDFWLCQATGHNFIALALPIIEDELALLDHNESAWETEKSNDTKAPQSCRPFHVEVSHCTFSFTSANATWSLQLE